MPKKARQKPTNDETKPAVAPSAPPADEIAWEDEEHRRLGEALLALWSAESPEPLQLAAADRALRRGFELRAGEMLADGRYRLITKVGQGAVTSSWKARDRVAGGLVAIKVLHGHLAADKAKVERFFSATHRAAAVQHPGIAQITTPQGDDYGFRWFATAWADGGTLEQAVIGKRLATHEALQALLDAADALAHAHAHGLLHRDLKPSNVLLWGDGSARVVDFDLLSEARVAAGGMGSVYAAPETMEPGNKPDARADVYSLAMVTLFVLHGAALPFWVLRDPERLISALTASDSVKSVLREALDWDLDSRCASVGELRDALLDDEALVADLAQAALEHGRYAVAAGHLRRRLDAGVATEDAVQARISLARALMATGDDGEAADLLVAALPGAREADVVDMILAEVRALVGRTGRWELLAQALGQRVDAGDARRIPFMIEIATLSEERLDDVESARAAWELVLLEHERRDQAREALGHLVRMAEATRDWDAFTRHARDLLALSDGAERAALQYRVGRVYLDELRDQNNGLLWLERAFAGGHEAAGLAETLEGIRAARGEWKQVIALMRDQARSQKPAKAADTLRRAAEIALYGYRQLDEAGALHAEILERSPEDAESARFLAHWHSRSGRAEEALALYAKRPGDVADQVDIAELNLALDRPVEAVAPLQAALAAAPGNVRALELLMDTFLDLGQPQEAAPIAARVAEAWAGVNPQPTFVRALIVAAECAWQQGDVPAAHAAFQRVLAVDPGHRRAWWGAARVSIAAADTQEALPAWAAAAPARFSPQEALARLLAGLLEPASIERWLALDAMGRRLLATLPSGPQRGFLRTAAAVDLLDRRRAIGPDLFRRLTETFPGWARRIDAVRRVWCEPAGDVQFPVADARCWPPEPFSGLDAAHREPMHADPVVLRDTPPPARASLATLRSEGALQMLLQRTGALPEAALAHPAEQPASVVAPPEVPRSGALVSEGFDGAVLPVEGESLEVGSARIVRAGPWFYAIDPAGFSVDGRKATEARLQGRESLILDGGKYRFQTYAADAEPPRPEPLLPEPVLPERSAERASPEDLFDAIEVGESIDDIEAIEDDTEPARVTIPEPQGDQRTPAPVARVATPIEAPGWSDLDDVVVPRSRAAVFFRDGDGERMVPFVRHVFVIGRRANDDIELDGPGRGGPCRLYRRGAQFFIQEEAASDDESPSERRLMSGERFVVSGRLFEFRELDEDGVALGSAAQAAPPERALRPVLHYDDGSRNGRVVEMPRFPFTIGRGRDNGLQISVDPALSRVHCRIEKRGDEYWVCDNESSRGTRVNGEPITAVRLDDDDVIQIGETQFEFELTGVDELADDETDEGPAPAALKRPSADAITVADGLEKVRVANRALGILMAAYDRSGGHGRGEAEIQIMIEASPKPYAALFEDVRVRGDGLPPLVVLYNVTLRPDADQRRLLALGLLDLIDRAVSVAADSLAGDVVDELLEQIVRVNYRDQLRITPVN